MRLQLFDQKQGIGGVGTLGGDGRWHGGILPRKNVAVKPSLMVRFRSRLMP
jgi:hypothetical protein